jgi:predicted nucleic acid-binding protein
VSGANVVDSSGWLEFFKGSERAKYFASAIEDADNLVVPVISVYEVYKKFLRERGEKDALDAIGTMIKGRVVDIDLSIALEAAQTGLPMADSIIYATAQRFGATLWTQDEDFKDLPSVRYFPK